MMNEEPMGQQQQQVTFQDGTAAPQDANTLVTPTAGAGASSATSKQLSVVSKAYDRGNKGYLDQTEQQMREMDESGRGHVPNNVVYDLMQESVAMHQKMATQRHLMIALACFTVILALANMATAFAAASLAKETTVSTATGDLNVKDSATEQRVGTTAKSETFEFGLAKESGSDRRRRLQTFEVTGDMDYAGHTNIDAVEAQALWATQQNTEVNLRWTCGAIGQGRQFVKKIQGGSRIPYMGNVTEETLNGTLYIYEVDSEFGPFRPLSNVNANPTSNAGIGVGVEGGSGDTAELGDQSSSAQLSGMTLPAAPQYQQIFVDCQEGAPVCTVANTNCCVHTWDEETMLFTDDCPADYTCAGCGCMCIPPGTPEFRCYSGCELTEPYYEAPIPGLLDLGGL